MVENTRLMGRARRALYGRWGIAIGMFLIYFAINIAVGRIPFVWWLATLVISGPMMLGVAGFSLTLARRQEMRVEQIFDGFKRFRVAFEANIRIVAYIVVGMLLLILPGIVKAIQYSQTFYVLYDDNSIEAADAMKKSKQMMDGHEQQFFYLILRYLGLCLLCVFTLGIAYAWLMLYLHVGYAKFYEDVKSSYVPETGDENGPWALGSFQG